MIWENLYYLFLAGLILAVGPCFLSCAPIFLGYSLSGTKHNIFLSYLIFSSGRILTYMALGMLGFLGLSILEKHIVIRLQWIIVFILGGFILVLGISTLLIEGNKCLSICKRIDGLRKWNLFFLGVLLGFLPCFPLIGILNYVVVVSKKILDSAVYAFVFGLGTIVSPLILIALGLDKLLSVDAWAKAFTKWVRMLCGVLLILLSFKIIVPLFLN